ncbi:hypothetical protein [Panacagrimonas sp.]
MRAATFRGIGEAFEIGQVDDPVARPGRLILKLLVDQLSMATH